MEPLDWKEIVREIKEKHKCKNCGGQHECFCWTPLGLEFYVGFVIFIGSLLFFSVILS